MNAVTLVCSQGTSPSATPNLELLCLAIAIALNNLPRTQLRGAAPVRHGARDRSASVASGPRAISASGLAAHQSP